VDKRIGVASADLGTNAAGEEGEEREDSLFTFFFSTTL
jgi:hypothetical protein